ncbi:hypothetical protein PGT21_014296 [Puccinia graminis f. sp. tritici]|uniref:SET domain-containing protein n=1 Tax=Puccinia graminis f. sp. tritici TaxID=56615 RepID=A0A5B0PVS9_PUCGR|nr:hypothetical protein PGTUg99_036773 [Puccinia graminis f. sp. tritici]KAA1104189.1 hypothetical protein PGT21_014296 [Puccinia graminis f. sp. tritici]
MLIKHLLALTSLYPYILQASCSNSEPLITPSISEVQQNHFDRANSTLIDWICKPHESPFLSWAQKSVYTYIDQVHPPPTLIPFRDGFYKSSCFVDPIDTEPEQYCIFVNPTINHGQGMVIVTPTELFETSLGNGLKLADDPAHPDSIKIVQMPEKGGLGAVAARQFRRGDVIQQSRPVALFANDRPIWATRFGHNIRRQAVRHLPLETRAAVASLHGQGQTEDEVFESIFEANMLSTKLYGDEHRHFGALVLQESRFNHACRPNVVYFIDHETQLMNLRAFESIASGEELTISYRPLEMDRESRRKELQETYGFRCTCPHCQMSAELGKLSDQRLARIIELRIKFFSEDPMFTVEDAEELVNLCEMEKIPRCIALSNLIAAEFYNSVGQVEEVRGNAEEARNMALLVDGLQWPYLDDLELLLIHPEKHDSYLSRR